MFGSSLVLDDNFEEQGPIPQSSREFTPIVRHAFSVGSESGAEQGEKGESCDV